MKKSILTTAALAMALSSAAMADDKIAIQPMKMGDVRMSCDDLIAEASAMEAVIGGSPAGGLMEDGQAVAMGTSAAQQLAFQAGAGRAGGAIGAVGGLLGKRAKAKAEEEAAQKALAEKRWIYVVGLYQGRNCDATPAE